MKVGWPSWIQTVVNAALAGVVSYGITWGVMNLSTRQSIGLAAVSVGLNLAGLIQLPFKLPSSQIEIPKP